MISAIMIKETIRIGIYQTTLTEEFHLLVEYSVDKITEINQGMNRIIRMTLREEAFEII